MFFFWIRNFTFFGVKLSPLCFFCNLCDETPLHIFYEYDSIKYFWSDLVQYFQNSFVLPILTPQTAIFGFLHSTNSDYNSKKNKLLINHILLIFKLYMFVDPEENNSSILKPHCWNQKCKNDRKRNCYK